MTSAVPQQPPAPSPATPSVPPPQPTRPRFKPVPPPRPGAVIVALCLLLSLLFAQLYRTRTEPLERDMMTYAVIAHEMRGGRALYSDVFDQKPPAIYLTYGAAEGAFGYNRDMLFRLGLIAAALTFFGAFAAGGALTEPRRGGLWAALLFALVGADVVLQANQPNTEVFINACTLWGFAIFVRAGDKLIPGWKALLAGMLFALATLYKTNLIVVPIALLCTYVAFPPGGKPNRRHAFALAILCFVVIMLAWITVAIYFAATGRWDAFTYAMFTYNKAYAGNPITNVISLLNPANFAPGFVRSLLLLPLVTLVGIVLGMFTPQRSRWLLLGAYLLSSLVAVALPGMYFQHYYQLLFPPLVVGVAWTLVLLTQDAQAFKRALGLVFALLAIGSLLYRESRTLRMSPTEVSYLKYGNEFINGEILGQRINTILLPNEIFYDASTSPELYFVSKRPILCPIFYAEATTRGPRAEQFTDRVLIWLDRRPPELVSLREGDKLNPRIKAWLDARYIPLPASQQLKPFTLLMRKGGILSRRLPPDPAPAAVPAPKQKPASHAPSKPAPKSKPAKPRNKV